MSCKDRFYHILSFIIIGLAIGIIGLVTFWLSYPYKPLIFNQIPIQIVDKEVAAGDALLYHMSYCKNVDSPSTLVRSFVNGIIFTVPSITINNAVGCRESTAYITIPQELPTGTYVLKMMYTYNINPLRTITVRVDTEPFNVVNN